MLRICSRVPVLRMAPPVMGVALVIVLLAGVAGCSATNVTAADIPSQAPISEAEAGHLPDEAHGGPEAAAGLEPQPEISAAPVEDETAADVQVEQPDEVAEATEPPFSEPRVDLVFFQTFNACGCLGEIGDVIRTALYEHLPEEMENKTVRFHSLYSDDPANQQYVRMYGSQPFDFFIVTYEDGKAVATPVREIWVLMDDYDALGAYVVQRVDKIMGRR